jgi:hypothetical protein
MPEELSLERLPSYEMRTTEEENAVMNAAKELAVKACMVELGFDYEPMPLMAPVEMINWGGFANQWAPFALAERSVAEEQGYSWTDGPRLTGTLYLDLASLVAPASTPSAEPAPEYAASLGSDDKPEGCRRQARQLVYEALDEGESDEISDATIGFYEETASAFESDQAVITGLAEWRTCMAGDGYEETDPATVQDEWLSGERTGGGYRTHADPVTQQEIAEAMVDWDCQNSLDLWRTFYDAQLRIEKELVHKYLPVFEQRKARDARLMVQAQEYIADHS